MSSPFRRYPNPVFEMPTYVNRVSSLPSTRQGGAYNPAVAGLLLFLLAVTVMTYQVRIMINRTNRFNNSVNLLNNYNFHYILKFKKDSNGVYPIKSYNPHSFVFPPG